MTIKTLILSPFSENTYIVFDETKECVIIDPGCYDDEDRNELTGFVTANNLKPVHLLNTHCHLDHVFGNNFIEKTYNIKSKSGSEDNFLLEHAQDFAKNYGLKMEKPNSPGLNLSENDIIKFGNSELKIFHTPGHSPGHLVFYNIEQKVAFTGDVLFDGSIGRTDLPGGNHETLIKSIKTKLYTLPDETVVYSGHGLPTTIGKEKKTNPFVKG